jgi:hypothetical protein
MNSKYIVFCTSSYSPLEISISLRRLNISHSRNIGGAVKRVDRKRDQPLSVHVTDILTDFKPNTVNFIVAAKAELGLTNFVDVATVSNGEGDLDRLLVRALTNPKLIVPKIKVLTPMDYVHQVAKPSLLNKIQTEIHKIQPYALRKQAQALVLDFLNNRISDRQLKQAMSDNLKLEILLPKVLEASSLRDAVKRLKAGKETVEEVAISTGHPTFELLYISKERK